LLRAIADTLQVLATGIILTATTFNAVGSLKLAAAFASIADTHFPGSGHAASDSMSPLMATSGHLESGRSSVDIVAVGASPGSVT
jgi:hypothetical protein